MSLQRRPPALVALLLVVAGAAVLAAGCGETVIDSAKTEGAIEENLEKSVGQKVASVECPSGVEVKTGKTFECTVQLQDGRTETATLKILNSEADVELAEISAAK